MSRTTKQHWRDYAPGRNDPSDPNPVACQRRVPEESSHITAKFRNVETARRCRNCNEALRQTDLLDRIGAPIGVQAPTPRRRVRRYPACPAAHTRPLRRPTRRRRHQ